jgi:hypothetical protein
LPRPPGHSYSTEVILLAVQAVIRAAVSFRGASAVIELFVQCLPQFHAVPAPNSVQSWLLRLGLHELTRPKERAEDWVLIVDHTIQLGKQKCLLIVGIRLAAWNQLERPLMLEDLTFILLDPIETSSGEVVHQQVEAAAELVGTPRAVLSDRGGDITSGVAKFTAEHGETLALNDIAHQAANVLKRELKADPRWGAFSQMCGQVQPKVKQTELAHLAPPTQKVKGRFMNLGPLIRWGAKLLKLLDTPAAERPRDQDLSRLEEKFGWLRDYREALVEWNEIHAVKDAVLEFARVEGYHADAASLLQARLDCLPQGAAAQRVAEALVTFVKSQSEGLKPGESVPASSEVLESLIGKGKRMQGQHSRGGFTKMVLAMAASVGRLTQDSIIEGLSTVRNTDLTEWIQQHLGVSLAAQRRLALPSATGTKPG